MARHAQLVSSGRPPADQLEGAIGLQHREPIAAARRSDIFLDPRFIERALWEPGMGKVGLLGSAAEQHNRQVAVLMHARQRSGAAPVGRTAIARMNRLARMVDPYLRVGIAAEAQVEHR
ncbi:MAG: hypothetical protein E5W53_17935, partial [Mesorhizobium sp.]